MTKKLIYVFGPMRGKPDMNRALFEAARADLEANPSVIALIPQDIYTPEGPAKECPALAWCEGMLADYPWVLEADILCGLPDWRASRGASREAEIAREHHKMIVDWEEIVTTTKEMIGAIVTASPRPAEGYHRMLHLHPEIFQRFIVEEGAFILIGAALPVGVPTGVHFDGCEIILDQGTAYGEVTIEPDKPKRETWYDRLNRRIERWEGKWD